MRRWQDGDNGDGGGGDDSHRRALAWMHLVHLCHVHISCTRISAATV